MKCGIPGHPRIKWPCLLFVFDCLCKEVCRELDLRAHEKKSEAGSTPTTDTRR